LLKTLRRASGIAPPGHPSRWRDAGGEVGAEGLGGGELTESEAIEALRRGSGEGMDFLVAEHEVRARRLAYAITGSRTVAEDVVAEAFLSAYRHIDRFQTGRRFEPWFLKIVANEALQLARRARRAERLNALLGRQRVAPLDPVEVAEANALRRRVIAAVRDLAPNERAAITLRYLLDLDERAVAETLGWPLGTVKTRLHRARGQLRERLGEELGPDLAHREGTR
jgi:RNA polymerase sigma-70 factor (ECF subfamily)